MLLHAEEMIAAASKFVGLAEEPIGSNDAAWLRTLLRGSSWKPGIPYCLYSLVALLAAECGGYGRLPAHIVTDGSCSDAATMAAEHCSAAAAVASLVGKLSPVPATGAIALLKGGPRTHYHACLVTRVVEEGAEFLTIEFNHHDMVSLDHRAIPSADFILW